MMKKEYIKPEMQVYEVKTQQLLVGSPDFNNEAPDDGNTGMY